MFDLPAQAHLHPKQRTPLQANRSGGFALIIALVCMGFLVLLLISLASLSGVELSVQRQHLALSQAKNNAMLGLNIALGELQKTMGPDQRISATASIRSNAKDGRRHWTGTWQANPDGGQATDFLGWLISLPASTNNTVELADTATGWTQISDDEVQPADADWITLVGPANVNASAAQPEALVIAGKVAVANGSYAWWVGDEGVKARINLAEAILEDPDLAEAPATLRNRLLAPAQMGIQKSAGGLLASVDRGDPRLPRLSNLNQLPMADISQQAGRDYFHDLTLYSRGILSDTRNGGLKHDLSHLLKHDTVFENNFGAGNGSWSNSFQFIPEGASIAFSYGSPNWGILRDYYLLADRVNNGNSIKPFHVMDNAKKDPRATAYQYGGNLYHWNNPIHPVLSWLQLGVGIEYYAELQADGSTLHRPRLHLRPLIALYNPHDIPLSAEAYQLQWHFTPKLTVTVGSQSPVHFRLGEIMTERRLVMAVDSTDFRPGETRYYGLDDAYDLSDSKSGAKLQTNWKPEGSYYVDLSIPKGDGGKVNEPSLEGATLAERAGAGGAETDSKRWGLTLNEKERLSFSTTPTEPTEPPLAIYVTYDPTPDFSDEAKHLGTAGLFVLKVLTEGSTGLDTTTSYGSAYFQETDSSLRPPDVDLTYVAASDAAATENLFWFSMGLKTPSTTNQPERTLIDTNPRFVSASTILDGFVEGAGLGVISGWTGGWQNPGNTLFEPQTSDFSRYNGFFGHSRNATSGTDSAVLFHVPREYPLSLGLFQHAALSRYSRDPAYIAANSYAPPRIQTDETLAEPFSSADGRSQNAYDWSYTVNLDLWDHYYLSGLDQDMDAAQLQQYLDGSHSLRNPRLHLVDNDAAKVTLSRLTDPSSATTATDAISHLELEGPFNINSTSVEAWKALLASNAGLSIPIHQADGTVASTAQETHAVFYRTPVPYASAEETADNSSRFWNGYRRLSDDELTALATEIVTEVKARAPFGSLADFVNRRPGSSSADHRRRGPLQAALDRTINKSLPNQSSAAPQAGETGINLALPDYDTGYNNPEDRSGSGAPGWILQGDLLQVIGPLLTPRSDTFLIRAYGEITDPVSNVVIARAWCEAIAQRSVNKVDPAEPLADVGPADSFGRRFHLLAFRWLDKP